MGVLDELFGERVDLGEGAHADMLLEGQEEPEYGEKRFFRTHPKPDNATSIKPDSLNRERCRVVGQQVPCSTMDGRGMGKELDGEEQQACPDCKNEILLLREDGTSHCPKCKKDFTKPDYERVQGRNVSLFADPGDVQAQQVKALTEQLARQQAATNQLTEQVNTILQLLQGQNK